jgi:hypothetical protein
VINLEFSAEQIKAIADSLPEPACERHRELFPQVLREWGQTDHANFVRRLSMETRQAQRDRIGKEEEAIGLAGELLGALDCLDSAWLVAKVFRANGRTLEETSRAERADALRRLNEVRDFLTKSAWPEPTHSFSRGQPRKFVPYLVLQDAAAIFEWYTGTKAARAINSNLGKDSSRFYRFASVLWPIIFGQARHGLSNAMKIWAEGRSGFGERSALLANINLRHPESSGSTIISTIMTNLRIGGS